ncbi:NPCBM/NEW2 domain-containing protein [Streptacidiphilus carbonis]|uniref:NPCBM/NEW2 domain-containing protein n=1 Tax=Streptacidiphilus carbonis TaxID=105422 RepID=UPI0006931D7A|nr:NPCBM/NEW2 domain-containing protein [Streptacidiphilus carbonis]
MDALPYAGIGATNGPSVVPDASSWLWQRSNGVRVGGTSYARGITVRAPSSVTIGLNRGCSEFAADAGVDDMTWGLGAVRFSVLDGDTGRTLWSSGVVRGGQPAVPVSVPLTGVSAIRLVTVPAPWSLIANVADWADARFTCH